MLRYWKSKLGRGMFRLEQLTLQKRLVIAYILIMLLPSLLISLYIFRGLTGNAIQEIQKNNEYALEIEQIHIKNNMETMKRAAQMATPLVGDVRDYLSRSNEPTVQELIDVDRINMEDIVRLQYNNPDIELIRIYMSNPYTFEMWPVFLYEKRIQKDTWYAQVMNAGMKDVWVFSRSDREVLQSRLSGEEVIRPKVSLFQEIQHPFGSHVGVLEVDMLLTHFFPNTFSALQEDQSQMVVLDRKGHMFRHPANGFLDRSGLTEDILRQQFALIEPAPDSKGSFEFIIEGVPFLGVYSYIDLLDAYMLKVSTLEPVYEGINKTRNRIILANVILLAILTLSTYFLNSIILKKLHVLTDSMKKVRQGDFGFDIDIRGGGEVGELAHHFRKMLRKINELIADAVNKQAASKEAELVTLKNQIDSHFLYNTLENIKMMAEINDQRDVSDALTSLGSMMRYNMRWNSEYVRLRDELNHIGNYINIANIRFDDKMKLVTDIPSGFMDQELLKMSLQPVVENSVKHGLGDKEMTIVIRAELDGNTMLISITDDGEGMTQEQVYELSRRIQQVERTSIVWDSQGHPGQGNGIGLVNVNSRIQMHFGKEYGLQVESEQGRYTRITIRIPYFNLSGGIS
ncbi:histidine kinase [Cohnella sp.]|uniref:sensor histidine kinase n=1 Tax=Cohnella sp. TaxID=1883426 RepID=UPI00356A4DB8